MLFKGVIKQLPAYGLSVQPGAVVGEVVIDRGGISTYGDAKARVMPGLTSSELGGRCSMQNKLLRVGSRVRVTSYGPFRGLRGTIRTFDAIAADLEEPFCFYLVALEGAYVKEPVWFTCDEVELIAEPPLHRHSPPLLKDPQTYGFIRVNEDEVL